MYEALLVDDEPFILEGLRAIVPWEDLGLRIAADASNGEEALRVLEARDISFLLTDVRMPRLDGIALAKAARELRPDIRIVVLSGYDDFDYVRRCLPYRIDNYLLKPVSERELRETIAQSVAELDAGPRSLGGDAESALREQTLNRWLRGGIQESELLERLPLIGAAALREGWTLGIVFDGGGASPSDAIAADLRARGGQLPGCFWFRDVDGPLVFLAEETSFAGPERMRSFLGATKGRPESGLAFIYSARRLEIAELPPVYEELRDLGLAVPGLLDRPEVAALSAEELLSMRADNTWPPPPSEEEIARHLGSGSRAAFEAAMNAYLELSLLPPGEAGLGPQALRFGAMDFMLNLVRASGIGSGWIRALARGRTVDEYRASFASAFREAWDKSGQASAARHPIVVAMVKEASSRLGGDLSLKHLADELSANPTYIGKLFRDEMGLGYVDYVNERRLLKARSLLESTSLRTRDVARIVGFQDPHYFCKLFRRRFGESPTSHRLEPPGC
jgi:Response regulator containing CheY-like receiver domain and AraC-type DNA-binding domain